MNDIDFENVSPRGGMLFSGGSNREHYISYAIIVNSGDMQADYFNCLDFKNVGNFSTEHYKCANTNNFGSIKINSKGRPVNLGVMKIMNGGKLDFNGLIITPENKLNTDLKKYLEKIGKISISYSPEAITLNGVLHFDHKHAKQALPHLFSKYSPEGTGFEFLPGNWLRSSYDRVSSISKKSGKTKYWKSQKVDDKYPLKTAINDVFKMRLLNKVINSNTTPKAKFDTFSKTAVFREIADEDVKEITKEANFNNRVQQYIISEIMSKSSKDLVKTFQNLIDKIESDRNTDPWSLNGITKGIVSFFTPEPKNHLLDPIRTDITKENFIEQLHEVVNLLPIKCPEVKDAIYKNLTENGSKFTKERIDNEIVPQIDETILTIEKNISVLKDYINTFDSQDKDELKSDPTIEGLEVSVVLEPNGTPPSSEALALEPNEMLESSETLESNKATKSRLFLK